MPDESNQAVSAISQNGGWVLAALTGTWAFITKWALSRYVRSHEQINETLQNIDKRLSRIEGRFDERDNR